MRLMEHYAGSLDPGKVRVVAAYGAVRVNLDGRGETAGRYTLEMTPEEAWKLADDLAARAGEIEKAR